MADPRWNPPIKFPESDNTRLKAAIEAIRDYCNEREFSIYLNDIEEMATEALKGDPDAHQD